MKSSSRIKLYRDQGFWRDLGFLIVAAVFVLVQAFNQPLSDALLYGPLLVIASFGTLLLAAHGLLLILRLLDAFVAWITDSQRTPRR